MLVPPLWLAEARQSAALAPESPAARAVDGWDTARALHAEVLRSLETIEVVKRDGRGGPLLIRLGPGGGRVALTPRDLPETVSPGDPGRMAAALAGCGSDHVVMLSRQVGRADRFRSVPCGCGSPVCPLCARARASRRAERLGPRVAALGAAGFRIASCTFTIPEHDDDPDSRLPIWTGIGDLPPDPIVEHRADFRDPEAIAYPVGGEPLVVMLARLRHDWRLFRDGAFRAGWRSTVAGYAYGIEWTGHRETEPEPGEKCAIYRWHAHIHALLIVRPGAGPGWWDAVARAWCKVTGGDLRSQACREVTGDDIGGAIREVLKYPYKPGDLTAAQLAEVIVAARGLHCHQVGGCLHACSPEGRAARQILAGVPLSRPDLAGSPAVAALVGAGPRIPRSLSMWRACSGWEDAAIVAGEALAPGIVREWDGRWWTPLRVSWLERRRWLQAAAHVEPIPAPFMVWRSDGTTEPIPFGPERILEDVGRWFDPDPPDG